jgi:molecular chaperone DnaK
MAELNSAWTAASEEIYKATQQGGAQQPGAGPQQGGPQQPGSGGETVTDAEFEEVK